MTEDFSRGLFKTLAVLKPYLPQLVIGGGWAPFLYFRYLAQNREHTPVLTRDIDLKKRVSPNYLRECYGQILEAKIRQGKSKNIARR